jgi:hypothetical protein
VAQVAIREAFVPSITVESMFRDLTTALVTRRSLRLEKPNAETLLIHHRHTPSWAKVVALGGFLFLVGLTLLLFFVKSTETVTVLGWNVEGGARFTATGETSDSAYVTLYRAFSGVDFDPAAEAQVRVPWVKMAAVVTAIVLLVGGCGGFLAYLFHDDAQLKKDVTTAMRELPLGSSPAEMRNRLGDPWASDIRKIDGQRAFCLGWSITYLGDQDLRWACYVHGRRVR